ncbi:MAG: pyridoxamine 5'-phosphate oxidase family protein [Bacteroidetes bacterium]|nr:pyridoxamine 5'-phosphate oxidase family protein [Bacteroidota bacterium]
MKELVQTPKTKIKRVSQRGSYDPDVIYKILDQAFICHVGFIHEGNPVVIPTSYGRIGDNLYLHGSAKSRMLMTLGKGGEICVTVTIVDGLVLARSIFHHSMNYRSVVLFGKPQKVTSEKEKEQALKAFTNHIIPGRWEEVRLPNKKELKGTTVVRLPIGEASAKIRTGPPLDDQEDYKLPIWAGVIPIKAQPLDAIPDTKLSKDLTTTLSVTNYLAKFHHGQD